MSVKPLLADPAFPGLGVASDPEIMRGVFADYLRPLRGGTYRVTDCRVSRVRYRRGTRCVLQYTLRLADSDTGDERIQWVTGVMYAKDRTRRKWEKLQAYLKLYQILLDGDRTSLVDLDNFAAADSVLDVANVGRYDAEDLS